MQLLKLGEVLFNKVVEKEGMLTHATITPDERVSYVFQPRGLNPKDGSPVERMYVDGSQFDTEGNTYDFTVPTDVFHLEATDIASGFTGKCVSIVLHLDGCIHLELQPNKLVEETGAVVRSHEFDLRRLEGPAIDVACAQILREGESELEEEGEKTTEEVNEEVKEKLPGSSTFKPERTMR